MPTANELLNKLPDKEKAKIANTLLDDVRKRFGSKRLGLVATQAFCNARLLARSLRLGMLLLLNRIFTVF